MRFVIELNLYVYLMQGVGQVFKICSDSGNKLLPMVPISITAEAFLAVAKSFPMGWRAEGRLDGEGGYLLILPRGVAELLRAIRQPGESFSDVILKVASDRQRMTAA